MSFKEKTLRGNGAVGLTINDSEKKMTPETRLPPSRGNIPVYYHRLNSIQKSSLKPLDQSKQNFI